MVFEKICEIIIEQLSLDDDTEITMETAFSESLEADSLDLVEILMSVEDEYNIEIPDEIAEKFKCVKDLVEYVESVIE